MKAARPNTMITGSANMKMGLVPNVRVTRVEERMVRVMADVREWSPIRRSPRSSDLK